MNRHQSVFTKDKRLTALQSYHILDTPPEKEYDAIIRLAASICKAPVALISFIDAERQWIKSGIGVDVRQLPRIDAFCNHTILQDDILEIEDVLESNIFSRSRFVVNDPQIRFYAGAPLVDPEGNRIGALCVMDMIQRKLSEEQLSSMRTLASEVMLHLEFRKQKRQISVIANREKNIFNLLNASPEIHCILDKDYRVEMISQSVSDIIGYTPGEITGSVIWDYFPAETRIAVTQLIKNELNARKNRIATDTPIVTHSGDIKWLRWSLTFLDNQWYAACSDISALKKAGDELNILSFATLKSPVGITIRDNEGRVVWMNEAFEQLLGYSLEEMSDKKASRITIGRETDMNAFNRAADAFNQKEPYETELKLYRKDGKAVWLWISNSPLLDENGNCEHQVGILIDITTRKKAESELVIAREEAVQLSRAKDMFISVMTHELRTPLNAVIGMSHLLLDQDSAELQRENLGILKFSAENLMTLINNVLDFTKIESGNIELERSGFDLHELVQSIASSMQFNANEKKIYVNYSVDEAAPQFIIGDRTRLCQVLLNLVGNAVKFTETGGIDIALKVTAQTDKDVTIRFSVTDTGIGIANDKINTIFESFKQAETDTSRKYGGTGLGLAITKKLIELHNSKIQVKSEPGKGSVFSFTIKFDKEYIQIDNNKNKVETGLQLNVLVVDDNQINRLLINKVLSKWGANIEFAENGQEAVDKIEANRNLDVVLMDIHMPVMGGLEATHIIRSKEEPFYQQLPIIALTASVLTSEVNEIQRAGMNDYILKPFDPKGLYEKLSKYQKVKN